LAGLRVPHLHLPFTGCGQALAVRGRMRG
jgi:hypothetical protein